MEALIKNKIVADHQLHAKDTGSADVQVALLTERISHLTGHLQGNNKDHSRPAVEPRYRLLNSL